MPADGESVVGLFDEHRQRVTSAGKPDGEVVFGLQHPGIARLGGEEHQRADADDAPVLISCTPLDRANLLGQVQTLACLPLAG